MGIEFFWGNNCVKTGMNIVNEISIWYYYRKGFYMMRGIFYEESK